LGRQGGIDLPEGALVPRRYILQINDIADRYCRRWLDPSVLDGRRGRPRGLEQIAQRRGRLLGPGQAGFEAVQMPGDQLVAGGDVRGGNDRPDLFQRHVQRAKAADDLSRRDLISGVTPVAGGRIDIGRLQ